MIGAARPVRLAAALTTATVLMALTWAAGASAADPIVAYELQTTTTQAGGHPDITASFELEAAGEPEIAKDIAVDLPAGLFGNPGAVIRCDSTHFALAECAPGSQVGLITIRGSHDGSPNFLFGTVPVYNLDPQGENETARLGFTAPILDVSIIVPLEVRTGSDYGIRMNIRGIPQSAPLRAANLTIWGFPAAEAHDPERFPTGSPGLPPGCAELPSTSCNSTPFPRAAQLVRPYIDNPSVCGDSPLTATIRVTTYQDEASPTQRSADFPAATGCEQQRFDPILNAGLTTDEADAPSGLDLQLKADQFLELPPSPSQLKSASVTLPEGLSINPDAADGQSSCTDAEAGFGSEDASHCPDNAKIGSFEVSTPALEGPLVGSLYIGRPLPGNQYRIFMTADGFGMHAKFVADVTPDPATGQLTLSVSNLPQVPFEEFDLHLFASDRGLVATPTACRVYQVTSVFVPWNESLAPQSSNPSLSIRRGPGGSLCPGQKRPFNPRLVAGTSNPVGGDFSDFHLRLDRDDGDQFLGDVNFTMPPGLTATLRGVAYCPDSSIAAAAANLGRVEQLAPSCPAGSEIGTTNVAAGPGGHPFHAVGKMYLAGPFKGAPLSVVAVTPALAGPYDYGVVVVRVAVHVDPRDAHVVAVSDTVPSIIGGIPIRLRSIQVNLDKRRFMINPTSCAPASVASQGIGDQGTVADFSSYFQAANCAHLPFKPKMTVRQVGGAKGTRRASNPQLQFDLNTRPGDANIGSLSLTLSNAFQIDQRHLGNLCSEKELAATQCSGRQAIGAATTTTPLLDQPLSGPVYAVSGSGGLPRLAFVLDGQVNLLPRAESATVSGGRLRTTVPVIPDAPIGHFHLTVFGGKQGYLSNTRSLCAKPPLTMVEFEAQNGRSYSVRPKLKSACRGGANKRRRAHSSR